MEKETKVCRDCKLPLPLSEFGPTKKTYKTKDGVVHHCSGLNSYCYSCRKIRDYNCRHKDEATTERYIKSYRDYFQANKAACLSRTKRNRKKESNLIKSRKRDEIRHIDERDNLKFRYVRNQWRAKFIRRGLPVPEFTNEIWLQEKFRLLAKRNLREINKLFKNETKQS